MGLGATFACCSIAPLLRFEFARARADCVLDFSCKNQTQDWFMTIETSFSGSSATTGYVERVKLGQACLDATPAGEPLLAIPDILLLERSLHDQARFSET